MHIKIKTLTDSHLYALKFVMVMTNIKGNIKGYLTSKTKFFPQIKLNSLI